MKENRLVVPLSMRIDVLDRLHDAHQGITKCLERAKTSVWWPGLSSSEKVLATAENAERLGKKSLFKSSKRARKERANAINLSCK